MPDWDQDSTQLQSNLRVAAEWARDHAQARTEPSLDQTRQWHRKIMTGLQVLAPAHASWIGYFRGEAGQESVRVRVGGMEGIDPRQVKEELNHFERRLRTLVKHLDERLSPGTLPDDTETLEMILLLMSWVHSEWIRIHPFANGNGRIARLWSNWVAMRYGLPPFVRLRPRPEGNAYTTAAAQAMQGDYEAILPVFRWMLRQFLDEVE